MNRRAPRETGAFFLGVNEFGVKRVGKLRTVTVDHLKRPKTDGELLAQDRCFRPAGTQLVHY